MFIGCLDSQLSQNYCRVFASSAAFGAAFEFFAQLCELGNALAVHRSAAGVPDSDISPGIVLLWHFKSRRIPGWTFQILAPEKSQTKITNDIRIVSQQCELTSAYDSGDSSMAMNMKN